MAKKRKKEKVEPVEGLVDPSDVLGTIERMHPDRIISFGMWHKHHTGYRDCPQMCVSNRKWTDEWWVEVKSPEELPDYFVLDAEDHIHACSGRVPDTHPETCRLDGPPDIDDLHLVPGEKKAEVITWKLFSQMMINPAQEMGGYGRGREYFSKKSTWHYLTAFFESMPTVLYIHIWPSEVRRFLASVRIEAAKGERKYAAFNH